MLAQLYWNAADYWPLATVAGVVLVIVTFWLYPAQTAGMPRRWQFLLPALRVAAIGAVCVSLLKPTLVRPRTEAEHGAVVVLVDRSASMGIADAQMAPARRVALADAMGILPEGRRTLIAPEGALSGRVLARRLDRLARAESDVDYAKLTGRPAQERIAEYEQAFAEALSAAKQMSVSLGSLAQEEPLKSHAALLAREPPAG